MSIFDSDEGGGGSGPLDDLFSGLLGSVQRAADTALQNVTNKVTASTNTAPVPDLTAAAAQSSVTSFAQSSAFGVSMPILLLGAGALLFLALRK